MTMPTYQEVLNGATAADFLPTDDEVLNVIPKSEIELALKLTKYCWLHTGIFTHWTRRFVTRITEGTTSRFFSMLSNSNCFKLSTKP